MSAQYIVRFDDICPTMNWTAWGRIEPVLIKHNIKPILAVVPDNRDPELMVEPAREDFWERVRAWQAAGWCIALHGYQHFYETRHAGLVGINNYSEFAGLPDAVQRAKLIKALVVFAEQGVRVDAWVAPGHAFDATTVKVLRDLGIDTISDGLYSRPVKRLGALWIPQQMWRFRNMPFGVWTVCYHHNSFSESAFNQFEFDIERFAFAIASMDQVIRNYPIKECNRFDEALSLFWLRALRFKRRLVKDTRRSILFMIPTLSGGGAERVIVTLLNHLDRSKFQLALAVVDMREAIFKVDIPEDVEFIDLQCSRVRYALPKVIRLIWQRRPDVVLTTLGHFNLALAICRPLLPDDVRYLARETIVVSEGLTFYTHPDWWARAYRLFYGRFDRVICQSDDMRDDLIMNFELPAEKAVVINNPIDVGRIRRLASETVSIGLMWDSRNEVGEDLIRLVSAGRLVAQKGFDLLIQAVALCGNPRLRLTLLGEGPLREKLEAQAQSMNVGGQVRFTGFQNNPYPFFAQSDVFVLSSRFEGFPNVVLEALACGTPVIATPALGGIREILNDVPGCVVTGSLTVESLAEALASFVPGERMPLKVVEPYLVEKIAERYAIELMHDTSI